MLASDLLSNPVAGSDPGNENQTGQAYGLKWDDLDANGHHDAGEPGLGGVTIYSDLNRNARLDADEPSTVTMHEDPMTDFDKGGLYWLDGLSAGDHVIREVVPDGFRQTFPRLFVSRQEGTGADGANDFSTVQPEKIVVTLVAGELLETAVSLTIAPLCFRPYELDVVASDPDVSFQNLTGVVHNGCGGATSTFIVGMIGDGQSHSFEIQFVDAQYDGVLDVIPVTITPGEGGGGHVVRIPLGGVVENLDFGNHRSQETSSIYGSKWGDANGNGEHESSEPGLGGVTVYSDLNRNAGLDFGEPSAVTMHDNPMTNFDEDGLYWLNGLSPGEHVIREVVPDGFEQTFPRGGAQVTGSETGTYGPGVAIDFDVTGTSVVPSPSGDGSAVDLELTVVWPDSCGTILVGITSHTVVGNHLLVQMFGEQVGEVCDQVISPESQTIRVEGLQGESFEVVGSLNEDLGQGSFTPTLTFVGGIAVEGSGAHVVELHPGDVVEGIEFGNQPITTETGNIHGIKWVDGDGNGQRDSGEPGLPRVTIYLDANFNGQFDNDEPHTVTMQSDTSVGMNQQGRYWLPEVKPGFYIVREVVPDSFEQTFPKVFLCEAIFCTGRGHIVNIKPGQTVKDIDFGNRPIDVHLGSIHGLKWVDRNGNGQREADEPGLPGVRIYVDLNNNGRHDSNEPRAVTKRENLFTDFDEGGRYRIDGMVVGEYVIREIVPNGFTQTFPARGAEILRAKTIQLRPGPAFDYQLTSVVQTPNAAGVLMTQLTFTVVWRNSCGAIALNQTTASVEGDQIRVEMFGHQTGKTCLQVLTTETQTVNLEHLPGGVYDVNATLNNVTFTGSLAASLKVQGAIAIGGDGGHTVQLGPDEVVNGVNFGNRPRKFIDGVRMVVWDGDTAVGTTGDGQSWNDTNNWSRDGVADSELATASNVSHVFFLPALTVGDVMLDNDQTINSLHFMENYTLQGGRLVVTSGEVSVAPGLTAVINSTLESDVGLTKMGEGKLVINTAVGDVTVAEGTLEASMVTGSLHVQAGATVAPGNSNGALNVNDATFEYDSMLPIEVGGLEAGTQHDQVISSDIVALLGRTLVNRFVNGFTAPELVATETISTITSREVVGSFDPLTHQQHDLEDGLLVDVLYNSDSKTDHIDTVQLLHHFGWRDDSRFGLGDLNRNDETVLLDLVWSQEDLGECNPLHWLL